jgi:hypothetical protein
MNCTLESEDRNAAPRQETVITYSVVASAVIAAVVVQALTNAPNVAEYLTTAVALASP